VKIEKFKNNYPLLYSKGIGLVNEAKTENLIRKILEKLKDKYEKEEEKSVIIEEKKSDNPRINKLLSMASKRSVGGVH
jgi:hypothetical protein